VTFSNMLIASSACAVLMLHAGGLQTEGVSSEPLSLLGGGLAAASDSPEAKSALDRALEWERAKERRRNEREGRPAVPLTKEQVAFVGEIKCSKTPSRMLAMPNC
jgi:hypothetical protein